MQSLNTSYYLSAQLPNLKEAHTQAQKESKQQAESLFSNQQSNDYAASLDAYQIGMPLKWVHWKSSAKRGELLIRQVLPESKHSYALWINPFYDHQQKAPTEFEQDAYADLIMSICDRHGYGLYLENMVLKPMIYHGAMLISICTKKVRRLGRSDQLSNQANASIYSSSSFTCHSCL